MEGLDQGDRQLIEMAAARSNCSLGEISRPAEWRAVKIQVRRLGSAAKLSHQSSSCRFLNHLLLVSFDDGLRVTVATAFQFLMSPDHLSGCLSLAFQVKPDLASK